MPARPPPVRSPSLARGESAACREATIPMAEGGRADVHNRPLHPVSRRARTPHEPTQDERHTGSDRTQNEQPTNTDAPARQATLSTPPTVNRPWIARLQPVSRPYLARVQSVRSPYYVRVPPVCSPSEARGRAVAPRPPSVDCPYLVRVLSVVCPFAARVNPSRVRDMTFVSPCSGRQRACSHKGSRSLDEIHYAIWRIFTGGIASSSDFMGRKGPFSGGPVVSIFFFNIKPDNCTKPYTLPIFSEYYAEHFIMSIALASNACILLSCCIPAGPVPCMLKST